MNRARKSAIAIVVLVNLVAASEVRTQSGVPFVGLGDSIGEGVQSGDASAFTQGITFLNLIAWRMGADFPLPWIKTNAFGAVGSTEGRSRYDLSARSRNLAVSGADVTSILTDAATALTPAQIDTETELVLFPETGSQIEIAERLRPETVACWIGNNDALGAVLAYDQLNATQLTPVPAVMNYYVGTHFGMATRSALSVDVNGSGAVRINSLKALAYPYTGTHVSALPVRLNAVPEPGYRFDRWSGSVESTELQVMVDMTAARPRAGGAVRGQALLPAARVTRSVLD